VTEVPPSQLRDAGVDLVVLQRPEELSLAAAWLGRTPGRDVPAVYLEHDTPPVVGARHPMAGSDGILIVHVTHFNALFWDCGPSPVAVVEHGLIDPGPAWTGELERAAVVVNDPLSRGRTVGADLLPGFAAQAPLDVFGMRVTGLAQAQGLAPERCREHEDLPQARLHEELPRRRVYIHPFRWTSLGLSLIEAMFLAMPVVALATTEAPRAVPPAAGAISTDLGELHAAMRRFAGDPAAAREAGLAAREAALARYGLKRFLRDWDQILQEVSA
jgi:hypothetical protein